MIWEERISYLIILIVKTVVSCSRVQPAVFTSKCQITLHHRRYQVYPNCNAQHTVREVTYFRDFALCATYSFCCRPDTAACPARTTSVSLELEYAAERAAWNAAASCVVIGDVSGRLHFVSGDGKHLWSQPLTKPLRR